MSYQENEGEEKVWVSPQEKVFRTPELVEKILPCLGPHSMHSLAQSKLMPIKMLEGRNWDKLLCRSNLMAPGVVESLTGILQLMKNRTTPLQNLLHQLCDRDQNWDYQRCVEMICPEEMDCHCYPNGHIVSRRVFQLLEVVEGGVGTTEQTVVGLYLRGADGPTLSLLNTRISRQRERVASRIVIVTAGHISIKSLESAVAFKGILQACQECDPITHLGVDGGIGEGGWEAVAEVLSLRPGLVDMIMTTKEALDEAKKTTLRTIWDSISGICVAFELSDSQDEDILEIAKKNGEDGWSRLEQVRDMNREDFGVFAVAQVVWGEDEEEDE